MQSIDDVDESWAWSPSSISPSSPPLPLSRPLSQPSPVPSLLLGPIAPYRHTHTSIHPPTQTHKMTHTTNINATSSRARLFDVLDDEKCAGCRRAECL